MKRLTYLVFLIAIFTIASCSTTKWPTNKYITKYNYKEVIGIPHEENDLDGKQLVYPMYPDGLDGISKLIIKETNYPPTLKRDGITGTVVVNYIVEPDGYIREILVIQSVHPVLDQEAIRVIKKMDRWIPGYVDGVPSRVSFNQPFKFSLR